MSRLPCRRTAPAHGAAAGQVRVAMFITRKHLSRRTVLRGAGVARRAAAARRDDSGCHGAGEDGRRAEAAPGLHLLPAWRDDGAVDADDRGHGLRAAADPRSRWQPFQRELTIVSGLETSPAKPRRACADAGHLAVLRASAARRHEPYGGVTIDQIAAAAHRPGHAAAVARSRDGEGHGGGSACDRNYGCSYAGTISFRTPTTPLPMESNPRKLFLRLFGQGDTAARARVPRAADRQPARHGRRRSRRSAAHAGPADRRMLRRLPRQRARDRAARAEEQAGRSVASCSCPTCRAPRPRTSTSTST